MATIQDEAFNGTLDSTKLNSYLAADASIIDNIGGTFNVTPLAAACMSGRLDVVKLLLQRKAYPNVPSPHNRTPLYFATTRAPPKDRSAIVEALINSGAKVDLVCDSDGNTPLMNAISQARDKNLVQLLVDKGASLAPENNQKETAEILAKKYGMGRSLQPKAQRNSSRAQVVDTIVNFVLLVISYVNSSLIKNVAKGVVKKLYNISGSRAPDVAKQLPEPKTAEEFKKNLNNIVKGSKFEKFFAPNDPFLQKLAEKASALRDDPTTDLGRPENIKRLTRLALYQPVIYCDDSGSMGTDNRYQNQCELVTRIARIATRIVPDDIAGVELRFINSPSSSSFDAQTIGAAMAAVGPSGGTRIGTNLREKILKPLIYEPISKKSASNPVPLRRPLLVCTITDGCPSGEDVDTLHDEIVSCRKKLVDAGYESTVVMFCLSQIGNDRSAMDFLDTLRKDRKIKDVIYVTTDQLDSKLKDLKSNERQLESWLLHLLTQPIMEGQEQ